MVEWLGGLTGQTLISSPRPLSQAGRPGPSAPHGCARDGAKAQAKGAPLTAIHLRVWRRPWSVPATPWPGWPPRPSCAHGVPEGRGEGRSQGVTAVGHPPSGVAPAAVTGGHPNAVFEDFVFLIMVRQAISRLPLVLKSGFTPSGADVAPLDAFVCLVLNGVAVVFGGVVSSVRYWRVSGVRIVRVGRLLARATNCRPLIRFIFAPRLSLLFLVTTLGSCVAFPSYGKIRETAPHLSSLWLCGFNADLESSPRVPDISSDFCRGCLGPQDNCSCHRMWKIKWTWGGLGLRLLQSSPSIRTTLAAPSIAGRPGPLHRCGSEVEKECYLVDPASSHMLVSKIKPCMCKYELIQTVKLRMAH